MALLARALSFLSALLALLALCVRGDGNHLYPTRDGYTRLREQPTTTKNQLDWIRLAPYSIPWRSGARSVMGVCTRGSPPPGFLLDEPAAKIVLSLHSVSKLFRWPRQVKHLQVRRAHLHGPFWSPYFRRFPMVFHDWDSVHPERKAEYDGQMPVGDGDGIEMNTRTAAPAFPKLYCWELSFNLPKFIGTRQHQFRLAKRRRFWWNRRLGNPSPPFFIRGLSLRKRWKSRGAEKQNPTTSTDPFLEHSDSAKTSWLGKPNLNEDLRPILLDYISKYKVGVETEPARSASTSTGGPDSRSRAGTASTEDEGQSQLQRQHGESQVELAGVRQQQDQTRMPEMGESPVTASVQVVRPLQTPITGRININIPSSFLNVVQQNGFVNSGNTCYMNSVMQVLMRTKAFRQAILRQEFVEHLIGTSQFRIIRFLYIMIFRFARLIDGIHRVRLGGNWIHTLCRVGKTAFDISPIQAVLVQRGIFSMNRQEDAQEFLTAFLSLVDENYVKLIELVGTSDNRYPPTLSSLFMAHVRYTLESPDGVRQQPTIVPSFPLSVPIVSEMQTNEANPFYQSVQEAVQAFFKPEELDTGHRQLKEIAHAPEVLVLHLNRFYYNVQEQRATKLSAPIKFYSSRFPELGGVKYRLLGGTNIVVMICDLNSCMVAVYHLGDSTTAGHYVSHSCFQRTCVYADDTKTVRVEHGFPYGQPSYVDYEEAVYVLFYERVAGRGSATTPAGQVSTAA